MDEPVEITSLLVQLEELLISKILLVWTLWRQDHLNTLFELVLSQLRLEAVQIESVPNIALVDLYHVLVPLKRAEPLDPAKGAGFTIVTPSSVIVIRDVFHLEISIAGVAVVGLDWFLLHFFKIYFIISKAFFKFWL